MGKTNELWQSEDAALKTTMHFFADELLPYFHIDGEVVGFGPTELVHLELQKLFQNSRPALTPIVYSQLL